MAKRVWPQLSTELAVGAANGIVIHNGAGEHNRARAELGSGTHDCSGMQHHPKGSGNLLKHLLQGLREGRNINSHHHLIGWGLIGGLNQTVQISVERKGTNGIA